MAQGNFASCRGRIAIGVALAVACAALAAPAPAVAWTQTTLYRFCSLKDCADGNFPTGGLIADQSGDLYGTTEGGGNGGSGTVFELAATGRELVLHRFGSDSDGFEPQAGLTMDTAGNLYGTTFGGGKGRAPPNIDKGTVFEMTAAGKERLLHSFCSVRHCADGRIPVAGLIMDASGDLFGTTAYGGAHGQGTVFELTPNDKEKVLHSFCSSGDCRDGRQPSAPLIMDGSGNLYGTTGKGGARDSGTVFKITPAGKLKVLHSFCSVPHCDDGSQPNAPLIMDASGNLYGTTSQGGRQGGGVVFEIAGKTRTVLHDFCSAAECADGADPEAGLIMDGSGNLYGTTQGGGAHGHGTVFELTAAGDEIVLYSFCSQAECADGGSPFAPVIMDQSGNLYGEASTGGLRRHGAGTLFALRP
jgi:uncharacterized repeat protein (TIGR03803 family)